MKYYSCLYYGYGYVGQTGVVSMKVLQENGFAIQGFEMNSDIGGLWNFGIHNKGSKVSARKNEK